MWLEEVSFHVTLCVWTDCTCDLLKMFWDPFCGLWMPMELSWQTTYSQTIVKTMFVRTTAFWHAVPSGIKVLAEKIGREPMHQVLKHQVSSKVAHICRIFMYICPCKDAGFNALHAAARWAEILSTFGWRGFNDRIWNYMNYLHHPTFMNRFLKNKRIQKKPIIYIYIKHYKAILLRSWDVFLVGWVLYEDG